MTVLLLQNLFRNTSSYIPRVPYMNAAKNVHIESVDLNKIDIAAAAANKKKRRGNNIVWL